MSHNGSSSASGASAEPGSDAEPDKPPSDAQVKTAAMTFALLSDPTRLRLLYLLSQRALDVTTLSGLAAVPAAGVSQHLAKLRLAGLVEAERDGRRQIYSVPSGHVRRLVLEALGQADHAIQGIPDHE